MDTPNPNSFKYFDPERGMTYNKKCPNCGCDTFASERVETCYEGKLYLTNKINKKTKKSDVVGVLHWDSDESQSGIWCGICYDKTFDEMGKRKCQ